MFCFPIFAHAAVHHVKHIHTNIHDTKKKSGSLRFFSFFFFASDSCRCVQRVSDSAFLAFDLLGSYFFFFQKEDPSFFFYSFFFFHPSPISSQQRSSFSCECWEQTHTHTHAKKKKKPHAQTQTHTHTHTSSQQIPPFFVFVIFLPPPPTHLRRHLNANDVAPLIEAEDLHDRHLTGDHHRGCRRGG